MCFSQSSPQERLCPSEPKGCVITAGGKLRPGDVSSKLSAVPEPEGLAVLHPGMGAQTQLLDESCAREWL